MREFRDLSPAICRTLAYMDVFRFPLTPSELHRYLEKTPAALEKVEDAVTQMLAAPFPSIARTDGYLHLPGRMELVTIRAARAQVEARLWPPAIRYGRLIGKLPFVRMVAVTGSLAMNNTAARSDIDYLIVTANDRLWVCRAAVIAVVRLAARRGVPLCPNYFLSERALRFRENNLYTAHELVQMVPVSGVAVYRRIRRLNRWTTAFLPNAALYMPATHSSRRWAWQPLCEWPLRTAAGRWLEGWEMQRKIKKYTHVAGENGETNFSADQCKGHFIPHGRRTLTAFQQRLNGHEHG